MSEVFLTSVNERASKIDDEYQWYYTWAECYVVIFIGNPLVSIMLETFNY